MFRWLHISDIHFCTNADGAETVQLRDALIGYVKNLEPFNALFITGDLRHGKYDKTCDVAETCTNIKNIANAAGITDMSNVYIVPGNHDVKRSDVRSDIIRGVKDNYDVYVGKFDSRLETLLNDFSFFRECENNLYRESFLPISSNPHFVRTTEHLILVHINTAILSCDNDEEGRLYLGTYYLQEALKEAKAKAITKAIPDSEVETKLTDLPILAIGHHDLHMFKREEQSKILELFADYDVNVYLCGHNHKLKVTTRENVYEIGAGCMKKDSGEVDAGFLVGEYDGIRKQALFIGYEWKSGNWAIDNHFENNLYRLTPKQEGYVSLFPGHIPEITKKKYDSPEYYIPGKLCKWVIDNKRQTRLPFSDNRLDLYEACLSDKHMVLIGGAGSGKSTAIEFLAHKLYEDKTNNYYPVINSLKDFTDKMDLYEYVPPEYRKAPAERIFLLLDGYDEIEDKYKSDFIHSVNNFTRSNPQVNITVSTRGNFYTNGIFSNFAEYEVVPFDDEDIRVFLRQKHIDSKRFLAEVFNKSLESLLHIPFYLVSIVEMYEEKYPLPQRDTLIENLIKLRFKSDVNKNAGNMPLEDYEHEIFISFQNIAIALQLLNRNYLTNIEFQKLISDRKYLKPNGLWERVGDTWQFKHANFQEYLAAKHLSNLGFNEIKEIITTNSGVLGNRWINTLSFVLPMMVDEELLYWLADNSPNLMLHFEPDKLTDEVRFNLFRKIMNSHREKNVWLPYRYADVQLFAKSFMSEKALEYLVSEISNPLHYWSLSNALNVIRWFDSNLFGKEAETTETLISCCKSKKARPYEREGALIALGALQLFNKNVSHQLFELFGATTNAHEKSGLCHYFIEANQVDEYIDFFLDGLNMKDDDGYFSSSFRLFEALKKISTPAAIKKVFEYVAQKYNDISSYRFEEIIENTVSKAISIYGKGHKALYGVVLANFIKSIKNYNNKAVIRIWEFFVKTKTKAKVFEYILKSDEDIFRRHYIYFNDISIFRDDEYVKLFADMYKQGMKKNDFIDFAELLYEDDPRFEHCKDLIQEVDGIIIKPRKNVDYVQQEKQGKQCYFNALFSKDRYVELANELFELAEDSNLTCKQLSDPYQYLRDYKKELEHVKWDLIRLCDDEECELAVKSHLEKIVNWEGYLLSKICKTLKENNNLYVSDIQKAQLADYCNSNLQEYSFIEDVTYIDESYTYTYKGYYLSFLLQYFNFPCDVQILLQLTMYPFIYEFDDNGNFHSSYFNAITQLEKIVDKDLLVNKVKQDIQNQQLPNFLIERHLEFCTENKIFEAKELATNVCIGEYDRYTKTRAVNYLFGVFGTDYVFKHVLDTADDELLEYISSHQVTINDARLVNRLLERANALKDKTKFLSQLIRLQSEEGLRTYYELTLEANALPDYTDDNSNCGHITEAISSIEKPELLQLLVKLVKLRFTLNFKDAKFFGLYNSLSKAFKNIGTGSNYETVVSLMKLTIEENENNENLKSFCNHIIENLNNIESINSERAWPFDEVIQKLMLN